MSFKKALLFLLCAIALLAASVALYSVRWIAIVSLIGIGVGTLISPVLEMLKRRLKIPKPVSAVLMFFLITGAVAQIIYLVFNIGQTQLAPVVQQLPTLLQKLQFKTQVLMTDYPWFQGNFESLKIGERSIEALSGFMGGIQLGATALGGFFFVLTLALYLATSPQRYLSGFLSLFPAYARPKWEQVFRSAGRHLRKWFFSQLLAMSIVGAATAFGMWLIGVNSWHIIGLLTAALDIVPYFGPLVAGTSACLLALASQPDKIPLLIGIFFLAQQLESNVVIPLIMKGRLELPPIHLMVLMLVLASWFGVLGILVASPLLTVLRTIYLQTYLPRMNQAVEPAPSSAKSTRHKREKAWRAAG